MISAFTVCTYDALSCPVVRLNKSLEISRDMKKKKEKNTALGGEKDMENSF